ncbi:MAG TPA: ABC transporter substrate-binding protein [Solirubrobacter sp.]|nr:ABC transporter substrate-binding protein [Solirubrobacter sp.]
MDRREPDEGELVSKRPLKAGAVVVTAALTLGVAACGGSESDSGPPTIKWYVFQEPSGAYNDAVKNCNEQAAGQYRIELVPLPTNADQQRELVVRRLAAEDKDIDVIGMDVIWTAEFGEAGWIREWTGADKAEVSQGTLAGPLRSGTYKDKLYAVPFTSNVQFLWYRKDRVPTPPKTWDEMLQMAEKLGKNGTIEVQAARYEGLTVWFNSLLASAGGQVIDDDGNVKLGEPAIKAATVMRDVARSPAADPNLSNSMEDNTRLAFQTGGPSFMVNWPYVYPSAKAEVPDIFKNMGVARYPAVDPNTPSRVTLGGINLGVSTHSRHPRQAIEAAKCLRSGPNQLIAAQKGGLPPTLEALYADKVIKDAYPGFSDLMKETIDDGVPRPSTPAYSDVSLAIQRTLHPPASIDPPKTIAKMADKVKVVAEGGLY